MSIPKNIDELSLLNVRVEFYLKRVKEIEGNITSAKQVLKGIEVTLEDDFEIAPQQLVEIDAVSIDYFRKKVVDAESEVFSETIFNLFSRLLEIRKFLIVSLENNERESSEHTKAYEHREQKEIKISEAKVKKDQGDEEPKFLLISDDEESEPEESKEIKIIPSKKKETKSPSKKQWKAYFINDSFEAWQTYEQYNSADSSDYYYPNPFNHATEEEEEFYNSITTGDWISAKKLFIRAKNINLAVEEKGNSNGENIFNIAADTAVASKKSWDEPESKDSEDSSDDDSKKEEVEEEKQIEAMFWLIDEAIKQNVPIKLNFDRYVGPLHVIAYYPANLYSLQLLNKLLKVAKPEDLNTYNFYGKTPLLEAIERQNTQVALKLLDHPATDINLYRIIPLFNCRVTIPPGTSIYEAAVRLEQKEVVEKLIDCGDYDPSVKYVNPRNDTLEHRVEAIAAQGNPDTLKVLFRQYGPYFSLRANGMGWTLLHMACYTDNLAVIKFLLNKEEVAKTFSGYKLSDHEYCRFINHRDSTRNTALGRALNALRDHDKTDEQIKLFVRCPYFDINQIQDMRHDRLIHRLVRDNELEHLAFFVQHRGMSIDFTLKDGKGNEPLRLACERGYHEIVRYFAHLRKQNFSVDPNDKGHKAKVAAIFSRFNEESWFSEGGVAKKLLYEGRKKPKLVPLLVEDLVETYETQEPINIFIQYEKILYDFDILFHGKMPKNATELKRHIKYIIISLENIHESSFLCHPKWINSEIWNGLYELLLRAWEKSRTHLKYKGINISIRQYNRREVKVSEAGIIDYAFLNGMVKSEKAKEQDQLLRRKYEPLLEMVARKKDVPTFAALLEFPDIKLNGLISGASITVKGVDNLISDSKEMQTLLDNARRKQMFTLRDKDKSDSIGSPSVASTERESNTSDLYDLVSSIGSAVSAPSVSGASSLLSSPATEEMSADNPLLLSSSPAPVGESKDIALPGPVSEPRYLRLSDKKYEPVIRALLKKLLENKSGPLYAFYESYSRKLKTRVRTHHEIKDKAPNRRLDSLARLVEGSGICAAVCFDGEDILIAANAPDENKELVQRTIDYFSSYVQSDFKRSDSLKQKRFTLLLDACRQKNSNLTGERKNTFNKFLEPLLQFFLKNQEKLIKIKPVLDSKGELSDKSLRDILALCNESEDEAFKANLSAFYNNKNYQKSFNAIVKTAIKNIFDIKKMENSLATSNPSKAFSRKIINAFRENKMIILNNSFYNEEKQAEGKDEKKEEKVKAEPKKAKGKKEPKRKESNEEIHAEMRIVDYLMKYKRLSPTKSYYIGVSKLCCSHCNLVLTHLNFSESYDATQTRGTSGEGYACWPVPWCMQKIEEFERVFAIDKELVKAFKNSYRENREDCLNIIKHIGDIWENLSLFGKADRHIEQDWSSSAAPASIVSSDSKHLPSIAKIPSNPVPSLDEPPKAIDEKKEENKAREGKDSKASGDTADEFPDIFENTDVKIVPFSHLPETKAKNHVAKLIEDNLLNELVDVHGKDKKEKDHVIFIYEKLCAPSSSIKEIIKISEDFCLESSEFKVIPKIIKALEEQLISLSKRPSDGINPPTSTPVVSGSSAFLTTSMSSGGSSSFVADRKEASDGKSVRTSSLPTSPLASTASGRSTERHVVIDNLASTRKKVQLWRKIEENLTPDEKEKVLEEAEAQVLAPKFVFQKGNISYYSADSYTGEISISAYSEEGKCIGSISLDSNMGEYAVDISTMNIFDKDNREVVEQLQLQANIVAEKANQNILSKLLLEESGLPAGDSSSSLSLMIKLEEHQLRDRVDEQKLIQLFNYLRIKHKYVTSNYLENLIIKAALRIPEEIDQIKIDILGKIVETWLEIVLTKHQGISDDLDAQISFETEAENVFQTLYSSIDDWCRLENVSADSRRKIEKMCRELYLNGHSIDDLLVAIKGEVSEETILNDDGDYEDLKAIIKAESEDQAELKEKAKREKASPKAEAKRDEDILNKPPEVTAKELKEVVEAKKLNFDTDQHRLIVNRLFSSLNNHEYLNPEPDPYLLYILNAKDSDSIQLLTRIVIGLTYNVPRMTSAQCRDLFNHARTIINSSKKYVALNRVIEALLVSATWLELSDRKIAYEFFRNRYSENFQYEDAGALITISKNWLTEEGRKKLLVWWLTILEKSNEKAYERMGSHIADFFNELEDAEKQKLFLELIKTFKNSKNIYVRRALPKILDRMSGLDERRATIMRELLVDSDSEVRNLAKQSTLIEEELENKESRDKPDDFESLIDGQLVKYLFFSAYEGKELERKEKKARKLKEEEDQEDLHEFKKKTSKSIPYQERYNILANGLKNKNPHIVKYCWQTLITRGILSKGDIGREDITGTQGRWLNILHRSIQNNPVLIFDDDLIKHLDDLRKIESLRISLTNLLLEGIVSNPTVVNKPWVNLLYKMIVTDSISDAFISKVFEKFIFILNNPVSSQELKYFLLFTIAALSIHSSHKTRTLELIIQAFNGAYGISLHNHAAKQLKWKLRSILGIEDVTVDLIQQLSFIRLDSENQETVEQILRFMVFVISRNGAEELGNAAATRLLAMLETTEDIFLFYLVKNTIKKHDLESLDLMMPLNKIIKQRLAIKSSNPLNEAWRLCSEEKVEEAFDITEKYIHFLETHDKLIPAKMYLLKARYLLHVKKLTEAYDSAEKALEQEDDEYCSARVLIGDICLAEGDTEEAIGYYQEAAHQSPFYLTALIKLHDSYFKQGSYYEADMTLARIQQLNPRFVLHPKYQLEVKDEKLVVPLRTDIERIESFLDNYVKTSVRRLYTDKSLPIQEEVKKEFETFKKVLADVFGRELIEEYFRQFGDILWGKIIGFPNQFPRYIWNIFHGFLYKAVPRPFHAHYPSSKKRLEEMQDLPKQILDSGIGRYIEAKDQSLEEFLTANAQILTAYDFIKRYAFTHELADGYALGLGSEISETYTILVSIFGLKNFYIAYEELNVEPSGELKHTHEFLDKVIHQKKPIVMFVPVLGGSRITLDEVEYFIKYFREKIRLDNLIFVFDAYNFLPMFILSNYSMGMCHSLGEGGKGKSGPRSFKNTIVYLADILGRSVKYLTFYFRTAHEHMLMTRIKVNMIEAKPDKNDVNYDFYQNAKDKLFKSQQSFMSQLEYIMSKWISKAITDTQIACDTLCLKLLDALLFTDLPWFGSKLQFSKENLPFLNEIKKAIISEEKHITEALKKPLLMDLTRSFYNVYLKNINDFLINLSTLENDIQEGLRWEGISTYSDSNNMPLDTPETGSPSGAKPRTLTSTRLHFHRADEKENKGGIGDEKRTGTKIPDDEKSKTSTTATSIKQATGRTFTSDPGKSHFDPSRERKSAISMHGISFFGTQTTPPAMPETSPVAAPAKAASKAAASAHPSSRTRGAGAGSSTRGYFKPILIDFDAKAERDADAKQQALKILEEVNAIYNNGAGPKKIGITYSANRKPQTETQIRGTYARLDMGKTRDWETKVNGSGQASVMHSVEQLLKTSKYAQLQGVFRILPISTCMRPGGSQQGGKVGELPDDYQSEELKAIEDHIQQGGVVLGWQNQHTRGANCAFAVGGDLATLTEKQKINVQLSLYWLEESYSEPSVASVSREKEKQALKEKLMDIDQGPAPVTSSSSDPYAPAEIEEDPGAPGLGLGRERRRDAAIAAASSSSRSSSRTSSFLKKPASSSSFNPPIKDSKESADRLRLQQNFQNFSSYMHEDCTGAGTIQGARSDDGQTSYEETRRRIDRENQEIKLKALERGSAPVKVAPKAATATATLVSLDIATTSRSFFGAGRGRFGPNPTGTPGTVASAVAEPKAEARLKRPQNVQLK